jgi:alkaline phosphatase
MRDFIYKRAKKALTLLSGESDKGYFIMIEGSRIEFVSRL